MCDLCVRAHYTLKKKHVWRTSLVVQWLKLWAPNAGGPGSIPGQETKAHMLQLRVWMPQLKIMHATMKCLHQDLHIVRLQWMTLSCLCPFAVRNCKLTVMMQLGWGFKEAKISQSPYLLGETLRKGKCSSKRKIAFKAECWRVDAFELWCWRILLRVPWTMNRSNQSILKEINPEYSLEWLMLKLKLQYFGYLMSWLIGKDPNAGKGWKQEKKGMTEDEMVG